MKEDNKCCFCGADGFNAAILEGSYWGLWDAKISTILCAACVRMVCEVIKNPTYLPEGIQWIPSSL